MELKLNHVTKCYGSVTAINDFHTILTPGVYGLLGPNGAGKSSLMHMIVDIIQPDSGQILFNGQNTRDLGRSFRERIGYMPQQQGMALGFSGRRFLWYMAALKGLNRREAKIQIERLLQSVNLTDAANRKYENYSGGMKQRLLIAQAMLNNPDILLLDEPTAGLDPSERIRLRNYISAISKDKIVLIATHVVSDIEFIAKEIIMLREGVLIRKASVPQLLKEIDGMVYEVSTDPDKIPALENLGKISGLAQEADTICVRLISEVVPLGYKYLRRTPRLEDLYVFLYE